MFTTERHTEILRILARKKRCSVHELASALFVSEATIRRDLTQLAAESKIQKVFGGALLCETYSSEVPYEVRVKSFVGNKEQICRRAIELVQEGMTLFLDGSTTPEFLVPGLRQFHDLQIITNSPRIPILLANSNFSVFCIGGTINHLSQSYSGPISEQIVAGMNADLFFFSARGLSEDGKITDSSHSEGHLKQTMLSNAKKSCFLCSSEKIGSTYSFTIAKSCDMDYVFSDISLSEALLGKAQLLLK